jgi:hypothetical protein
MVMEMEMVMMVAMVKLLLLLLLRGRRLGVGFTLEARDHRQGDGVRQIRA